MREGDLLGNDIMLYIPYIHIVYLSLPAAVYSIFSHDIYINMDEVLYIPCKLNAISGVKVPPVKAVQPALIYFMLF